MPCLESFPGEWLSARSPIPLARMCVFVMNSTCWACPMLLGGSWRAISPQVTMIPNGIFLIVPLKVDSLSSSATALSWVSEQAVSRSPFHRVGTFRWYHPPQSGKEEGLTPAGPYRRSSDQSTGWPDHNGKFFSLVQNILSSPDSLW